MALLIGAAALIVVGYGAFATAGSNSTSRHPRAPVGSIAPAPVVFPPDAIAWAPLRASGRSPEPELISTNPPPAVPAVTPACHAGQLQAVALQSIGATSTYVVPVLFRNASAVPCQVNGYPDSSVLGAFDQVLATASGTSQAGTAFDGWAPMPVLLAPRTPALPTLPSMPVPGETGARGQARLDVSWYDCRPLQADSLLIRLPVTGDVVRVPFEESSTGNGACAVDTPPADNLVVGDFEPEAASPPQAVIHDALVTLAAPPSVRAGTTLVFSVSITNLSATTYSLSPCPDYTESLAGQQLTFQLNCTAVHPLAPDDVAVFLMQLALPHAMSLGLDQLTWSLADPRMVPADATATTSINVSAP